MRRRSNPIPLRLAVLLLAIVSLAIIVIRTLSLINTSTDIALSETPTLDPLSTFDARELLERTVIPIAEETQPVAETPADAWANAVLDSAIPLMGESPEEMSWWGQNTISGVLRWQVGQVLVGGTVIDLPAQYSLEIAVIDDSRSRVIATASPSGGALRLTVGGDQANTTESWLLTGTSPLLTLKALAVQADERNIELRVAYLEEARSAVQVVVFEAASNDLAAATKTPDVTAVSAMPTATRSFDPALGDLISSHLGPVIDEVIGLDPNVRQAFIERHAWTGVLAASEADIRIGGRVVPIDQATELTFYLLEDGSTSENVRQLFTVVYTEPGTTRFPEDQVFFQAHRMKEVLYWAAARAAEEDGQLLVAFDDNGSSQAITILGFRPFGN